MAKDKIPKIDVTETAKQLEDEELEKSIVSYLMICSFDQIQEIRRLTKTEYFYHDAPRHIYQLICWFNDRGENVTPMLLQPEIMKRGKVELIDFANILLYQDKFKSYIELIKYVGILRDYAIRRKFYLCGHKLIKEGTYVGAEIEKVGEDIKRDIDDILNETGGQKSISMQELLNEIQKQVDANASGKHNDLCMPTGFNFIDKQDGLSRGDLDIIAAESSVGKTSFAVSLTINVIERGNDMAFYSTEMKPSQIVARILSNYTNLYSSTILKKPMNEEQMCKFNEGMTKVHEASSHLFFHERNTSNISEIIQSIRSLHSKHNIKGAVIDFIQRLSGRDKGESDDSFYGRVSQRLKDLAQELDIWIILLSQLNRSVDNSREAKDNTKYIPMLSRLRGSGQIVEAADNVWFIYRPDYYNKEYGKSITYPEPFQNVQTEGTAMVIVAKGRNVGTGSFIVGFKPDTTHFYELDKVPLIYLAEGQAQNELDRTTNPTLSATGFTDNKNNNLPF